jgi:hypothetical protein
MKHNNYIMDWDVENRFSMEVFLVIILATIGALCTFMVLVSVIFSAKRCGKFALINVNFESNCKHNMCHMTPTVETGRYSLTKDLKALTVNIFQKYIKELTYVYFLNLNRWLANIML